MMRLCLHIALGLLFAPCLRSEQISIVVTNPSAEARSGETVVLDWNALAERLPALRTQAVGMTDEQGRLVTTQTDDLDADGVPDEVAFLAALGPGERRVFHLGAAGTVAAGHRSPSGPRTDAGNWKRVDGVPQPVDDDNLAGTDRDRRLYRFDGAGWESEVAAYRLYLDGRNAVDIQGKRIPGLYWNWIGASETDYQADADWGMDVLHVGSALGVGGIGFWVADSVLKPLVLDRQRCRIIARGPVRAIVRVEYRGWELGNGAVDVTSLFSIAAGDRVTEHRLLLEGGASPRTIATGIVKHDSTETVWDHGAAWLSTTGLQSRAGDSLMLALTVPRTAVIRTAEDAVNHLLLLRLEKGKPLRMLISSYWQGEIGRMWSKQEVRRFLDATARRFNEPILVQIQKPE
jgi:hypothetical protein